jgi:hypothetical protein
MEALVYCGTDENLLVNNIHMCKLYEARAARLIFYPDFYMPLQRICYAASIFYIHFSFRFISYTPPTPSPSAHHHHHLVHPWFHGSFAGVSTWNLAYSIGTPPFPKIPFFSIAILNNLPESFVPGSSINLNSSQADCIDWYCLFPRKKKSAPTIPKQKTRKGKGFEWERKQQTDITPPPPSQSSSSYSTSTPDE